MPNKIYTNSEASRTWSDAATTSDELMDMGGLAASGVVIGSYWDRGAGAKSALYQVELFVDGFATAPVVGEMVDIIISQSNATAGFDGNPTTDPTDTAEGTMTANQAQNCVRLGGARVYSTTAVDELKITIENVRLSSRYIAPVVHNRTADALASTGDAHMVTITPMPDEVQ